MHLEVHKTPFPLTTTFATFVGLKKLRVTALNAFGTVLYPTSYTKDYR